MKLCIIKAKKQETGRQVRREGRREKRKEGVEEEGRREKENIKTILHLHHFVINGLVFLDNSTMSK